ncbi:hypothetical protein MAE02_71510 [Microvirga aerophila]|uniref:Uncharacterized protein n=1 Tax=Microvirga aerophila TaxID=670291 RepID=A0A512C5H8_9HYPH|nr:hypothetical protein MAE02_71510 [Microvirga aerophila]
MVTNESLDLNKHLRREKGIAAALEEIVVDCQHLRAKQLPPQLQQFNL